MVIGLIFSGSFRDQYQCHKGAILQAWIKLNPSMDT